MDKKAYPKQLQLVVQKSDYDTAFTDKFLIQ